MTIQSAAIGVKSQHRDYIANFPRWKKIRDALAAEIERLREFERDAVRYRWLMQNTKFGIGRNGKDWDLQVDGSAPDSISEIGEWIDNRMDGMM